MLIAAIVSLIAIASAALIGVLGFLMEKSGEPAGGHISLHPRALDRT